MESIDNLKNLIQSLKSIGFFARIFSWNRIKSLLIDAATDLQRLVSGIETAQQENADLTRKIDFLAKELDIAKSDVFKRDATIQGNTVAQQDLKNRISNLEQTRASKEVEISNLNDTITAQTVEISRLNDLSERFQHKTKS